MPTKNILIETLDNGAKRETATDAPVVESENARVRTIGAFRQDNVADSQSGVALLYQSVDAASLTFAVAPRAGTIVGMTWGLSAAITAGVATLRATVAGTARGDAESIVGGTAGAPDQTTAISFAKGDKLGVAITTDANVDPNTVELFAELIVKYEP